LGREPRKRTVTAFREAFPGIRFAIDDLFGEGDRVAARLTFQGAQAGPIFGIPPSGKHVTVAGILIARLRDGKIAETWLNYDLQRLLEQLGATAPLGPVAG
jgi:predicted ester cyclase